MATGSSLTQNYSRSQSEIQGDLHNWAKGNFYGKNRHPYSRDSPCTVADTRLSIPKSVEAYSRHVCE
ncbi:hypothetical protein TNCV_2209721 [Trichonephila clavipes]|nr:hypothetical protein TNCV_2209721 [Trichonephila clavipes]